MPDQVYIESAPVTAGTVFGQTLAASTSVTLLAANAEREAFVVSADTADAWLSYGASPALANKGVRLKAGLAPFREESWKGAVQVISTGLAVICGIELDYSLGDDQGQRPAGADSFAASGPSDTPIPAPTAPPPGTPIT